MTIQSLPTSDDVKHFYDRFSEHFIRDYRTLNPRVQRQLTFFSDAIPGDAQRVLVIGCGSGEGAHFIASRVAKNADVLGVDLSSEALKIAKALFCHARVEYKQTDITKTPMDGSWDAIVLPDVYEHIPKQLRKDLHTSLQKMLSHNGRLLFSVPSPGHQAMLREMGKGLQIIDEDVTLEDFVAIAYDTGTTLTYYNMISVFNSNDYVHAMLERGAERVTNMEGGQEVLIKGGGRHGLAGKRLDRLKYRLVCRWRRRRCTQLRD